MKIAIQGHLTRGHEVIQILENLSGKNTHELSGMGKDCVYYYNINSCGIIMFSSKYDLGDHKFYTLEEFEKEFPFKVGDEVIFPVKTGWASGKVTGLTYIEDQLKYEVDSRIGGYRYIEPHKLSLYPMKEERNITLTLDKAKEWYKKGGELKEIALQAYSEEELLKDELPKSWDEFCKRYPIKKDESYINSEGKILSFTTKTAKREWNHICPSKKSAETHLAMIQLEQLRDCWRQGWIPTSRKGSYSIKIGFAGLRVYYFNTTEFLSFPTREMAEEFLKCFRDLIEKAGDLI